jgi:DtxR family Mn-dependent transcriptional regulator
MKETSSNYNLPSSAAELLEEALGEVYKCFEKNMKLTHEVEACLTNKVSKELFQKFIDQKYIEIPQGTVTLSGEGERIALAVIRRERLTERLLKDVLNMNEPVMASSVCRLEHVLSQELTDSICTLLGHPARCPHELPIPPGECCKKALSAVAPVIFTLDKLESGREAKVAYLKFSRHPEFDRLMSSGLMPGASIKLIQKFPAFVVQIGESQIAFDLGVAQEIFVRNS